MDDRIIALIDMDCFYVQCEQRLEPDKWHKPCVVAQYNNWKGGGIIAVNYEARAFGIKRGWMGDQAQKVCPELHIFKVPDENGKAKLDRYRDASVEVFQTIANFIEKEESALGIENLVILERASVDEAFIDLTKLIDAKPLILYDYETMMQFNTKLEFDNIPLEDWLNQPDELDQNDKRLIMAAHLVGQLRQRILEETQFKCSAGISHNKMLSKLACGLNKPNAQTILPMKAVQSLFKRIDIRDVRSLGGKLGRQIKDIFQIQTMYQLSQLSRALLNETFDDKTAEWLYDLANGIDREPVSDRRLTKSIGCGKNFRGKSALSRISDINHWIHALLKELYERITKDKETNQRLGKLMVVGYFTAGKGHCHRSVSIDVQCGDYPSLERLASDIMKQVFPNSIATTIVTDPLQNLSLAVTKFVDAISLMNNEKIEQFFTKIDRNTFVQRQQQQQKESTTTTTNERPSPIKKRSLDQLKTTVKKSPTKKAKLIQTNTLDRYLRPSTSNQYASDDNDNAKIDMNDPHVRQINREFDELLDSFFYRKILFMLENGEWKH